MYKQPSTQTKKLQLACLILRRSSKFLNYDLVSEYWMNAKHGDFTVLYEIITDEELIAFNAKYCNYDAVSLSDLVNFNIDHIWNEMQSLNIFRVLKI